MNITSCPRCGGRVRSVSIGWKCESCQGFIDMRGEFHPHKEEPFMPPMTNADRIRDMSDEELASFMMYPVCKYTGCKGDCTEKNIGVTGCRKKILNWLQQPAKEE